MANYLKNTLRLLRLDAKDIRAVYAYAIFAGLISLVLPLGIQSMLSYVVASELSTSLVILIILVTFSILLQGIFQVNQLKLIERLKQKAFVRLAYAFNEQAQKTDLVQVKPLKLREYVNRYFDISNFQKSITKLLIDVPTSVIQIFFGLILLALYHPLFILFGLVLLGVLVLILAVTGRKGMRTSINESNSKYEMAFWLQENTERAADFAALDFAQFQREKTNRIMSGYLFHRTKHFRVLMSQYYSLVIFKVIISGLMLSVGAYLLLEQFISIGQFVAAEIVIILLLSSVEKLIGALDDAYDLLTSVKKMYDMLDLPSTSKASLEPLDDLQTLEFENFQIFDGEQQSKILNFQVQRGDVEVILDPSGRGFYHFLRALGSSGRLYKGQIRLNEIWDESSSKVKLTNHFSFLGAQSNVFNGTILQNINADGNSTYDQIVDIAKRIGASDLILKLPNTYETIIDERAETLNPQLRKNILLMRTFCSKRPIWVLEEPFRDLPRAQKELLIDFLKKDESHIAILCTRSNSTAELFKSIVKL